VFGLTFQSRWIWQSVTVGQLKMVARHGKFPLQVKRNKAALSSPSVASGASVADRVHDIIDRGERLSR
jgi:hypothetical protein